jgi:hypothetical protein
MDTRHPHPARGRLAPAAALGLLLTPASTARAQESDLEVGGGVIHVSVQGRPDDPAAVNRWVDSSARAVTAYLGRFPVPTLLVVVSVDDGERVFGGVTHGGRRPAIRVRIGRSVADEGFRGDWVLVHEMLHLAFPGLTTDDVWAEEGLSTYAEPWARALVGLTSPEQVWPELVRGLPHGDPANVSSGLHGTRTWGRTYWGGALFWLLADMEIREKSGGAFGLPDALRGILDAGGDIRAAWSLAQALAAGDRAVKQDTLTTLYARLGSAPGRVDLARLWRALGIRPAEGGVTFDDAAPQATVRRAMAGAIAQPVEGAAEGSSVTGVHSADVTLHVPSWSASVSSNR